MAAFFSLSSAASNEECKGVSWQLASLCYVGCCCCCRSDSGLARFALLRLRWRRRICETIHMSLVVALVAHAAALGSMHVVRPRSAIGRISMMTDPNAEPAVTLVDAAEPEARGNASEALGLAGLAASGAGISTIAATAGGVCAGGACVAGAPVAAPVAAIAFGGFQTWLAGGLVAAATFFGAPTATPPPVDATMAIMVRQSTPIADVKGKGTPTVIEFYRPACPRCNRLAPSLVEMEEKATSNGVSWVMINTDEPSSMGLIRNFGVSEVSTHTASKRALPLFRLPLLSVRRPSPSVCYRCSAADGPSGTPWGTRALSAILAAAALQLLRLDRLARGARSRPRDSGRHLHQRLQPYEPTRRLGGCRAC